MAVLERLIIEDDEGKTTAVPVGREEMTIGRLEGNAIRLMERNVSRRHARVMRDNGSIFIEDLNSFNGVRINGERIDRRLELKEGDLVEIGDYHIALQSFEVSDDIHSIPPDATPTVPPDHALREPRPLHQDVRAMSVTLPDSALAAHIAAGRNEASGTPGRSREEGVATASAPRDASETIRDISIAAISTGDAAAAIAEPVVRPPPPRPTRSSQPAPPSSLPPFPAPTTSSLLMHVATLADTSLGATESGEAAQHLPQGPSRGTTAVAPIPIADVARLICVSTEYAGREFPLTRPEVVIGRVEDNDIVIEHRSVSRNHAKILHDGRVFKIADLESANGVLVNGEEYAITDLRRGDLIELGHVKFRFMPAGERFVPTDEEARTFRGTEAMPQSPMSLPPPMPSGTTPGGTEAPTLPPSAPGVPAMPIPAAPVHATRDRDIDEVDASQAATVTDTPMSALAASQGHTPRIVPAYGSESMGLPRTQPIRISSSGSHARGQPTTALHADDDSAATRESTVGMEPTVTDAARTRSGRSRAVAAVAVVVLMVVGLATLFSRFFGSDEAAVDRELEALMAAGDCSKVVRYYIDNVTSFGDKDRAAQIFQAAQTKCPAQVAKTGDTKDVARPEVPKSETEANAVAAAPGATDVATVPALPQDPAKETAPPIEQDAAPKPGVAKPVDAALRGDQETDDAPVVDALPLAVPKEKKTPPRPVAPVKRTQEANQAYADGVRALTALDLKAAEAMLTRCLKLDPSFAACHRALGVLYAKSDRTRASCTHYRKYVEMKPDATDADAVAAIIRQACSR